LFLLLFASIGTYLIFFSKAATTLSADFNSDNKVDIFDLSILSSNWGKTGITKATGDANGDGSVNIFDLSALANEWGKTETPVTYTVVPSGKTDDTDAQVIQAAIDAKGTNGGDITFAPGTYNLSKSIKLPPGNTAMLILSGNNAKIILRGAMGFLEFNDTSNYQKFQNFTIQGFELDASLRLAASGYYFIGATNSFSSLYVKRGDVENINIKDCYIHGAPSLNYASPIGNAVAISLGTKQGAFKNQTAADGVVESTTNYVKHINIDNVRIEDGDSGILVMTEVSGSITGTATHPSEANSIADDINISNVRFVTKKTSENINTTSLIYYNTGIQVGGWGKGGTLNVRDCYLEGSPDNLLELDNMMVANITNVETKSSRGISTTIRTFGYPLDAVPPGPGTMTVTYTNMNYTQGVGGPNGFGYSWAEVNHKDHPTYNVVYNNCHVTLANGTTYQYTGPGG
jgi:hypothetical protein